MDAMASARLAQETAAAVERLEQYNRARAAQMGGAPDDDEAATVWLIVIAVVVVLLIFGAAGGCYWYTTRPGCAGGCGMKRSGYGAIYGSDPEDFGFEYNAVPALCQAPASLGAMTTAYGWSRAQSSGKPKKAPAGPAAAPKKPRKQPAGKAGDSVTSQLTGPNRKISAAKTGGPAPANVAEKISFGGLVSAAIKGATQTLSNDTVN